MKQFYFLQEDDEVCRTKEGIFQLTERNTIEVFTAKRCQCDGYMICKIGEVGSKGYCGKECNDYEPRNKKSGICRHYSTKFYEPGDKITLKR